MTDNDTDAGRPVARARHVALDVALNLAGGACNMHVLLAMLDNASPEGLSWVSERTIERETGITRKTIRASRQRLTEAGLIVPHSTRTGNNGGREMVVYLIPSRGKGEREVTPWAPVDNSTPMGNAPHELTPWENDPKGYSRGSQGVTKGYSRGNEGVGRLTNLPLRGGEGNRREGEPTRRPVETLIDPTHGDRHPKDNPNNVPCRQCGADRKLANTTPTPVPPPFDPTVRVNYCACGSAPGQPHARTCEVA